MSWGGSAQSANDSLKSNRYLLGKRPKLFKREKSYYKAKRKFKKVTGGIDNYRKLSNQERNKIKNKIRKQQKKERLIYVFLFLISFTLITYFSLQLYKTNSIKSSNKSQLTAVEKEYLKFIMFGDTWIEDGKWNPAITMYKKAIALYPNSYDANYRLVLAYRYKCERMKFDCDLGESLTESLLNKFPEKSSELRLIDSIFKTNKSAPIFLNPK